MRASIERFPPAVQERLRVLQERLAAEGRFWEPRDHPPPPVKAPTVGDRLRSALGALIVAVLVVALGVGLFNIALFLIHAGQ